MSVRREVISLSQLLQRRKTPSSSEDQQFQLPLSQPTPTNASRYGPVRQRMSQLPVRTSQQQPMISRQHSVSQPFNQGSASFNPEHTSMMNSSSHSQSQEAYEDLGGFTSQSQGSYSQSQNLLYSSQEETNFSRPILSQRQLTRDGQLQDTNKTASLPSERTQIDKDTLEKVTAPIQSELAEMSASIRAQASDHRAQVELLKAISTNIDSLHGSVRQLHKQNEDLRASCDTCQETIVDEASTIKSAIRSLQSRFGDMESQVHDLTDEVGTLVRSSRQERSTGIGLHRSQETAWKCNGQLSSGTTYRKSFGESGDFSYRSRSQSQRDDTLDDTAYADEMGLRRSLQRIEEVRAKRRRTHLFYE